MTTDRWEQINRICYAALEVAEGERPGFLEQACGEDVELRREVASLLALNRQAEQFIEVPALQMMAEELAGETPSPVGRKLGPYEILQMLGAGGMGEVYKARDTRLNRTVAIKVLPEHLSERADLRKRLEREARAIAGLNHPNICALYDIGREDGIDFLVMEYVEGETLSKRLRKGPLPTDQLLRTAVEIATALDQAHRHGVIHRDLKPGNVMLTKTGAKLLDFGLARQSGRRSLAGEGSPIVVSPPPSQTESESLTKEGMLLGTLEYMAPEQVEGKDTDTRTDIFAMGVMIYEMATARKAFEGDSRASLAAAILTFEPLPISKVQPMVPPTLERVVKRCLAKDPEERWQSIRDLTSELQWIAEEGGVIRESTEGADARGLRLFASQRKREQLAWAVAVLLLISALVSFVSYRRTPSAGVTRLTVDLPEGVFLGISSANRLTAGRPFKDAFTLTPDGRTLVFVGSSGGKSRLYVRPMDQDHATAIPGTEGAHALFLSPDGREVAFFSPTGLRRVPVRGGEVRGIATTGGQFLPGNARWTEEDRILLSSYSGVLAVPSNGGKVSVLIPNRLGGDSALGLATVLPGGRTVLYNGATLGNDPSSWDIVAESLDSHHRVVITTGSDPRYLDSGCILFMRDGKLMAVGFDADRLRVTSDPVVVLEDVMQSQWANNVMLNTGVGLFSVARSGTLAYVPGGPVPVNTVAMNWVDLDGTTQPLPLPPDDYISPRLSPDGTRLAYVRRIIRPDHSLRVYDIKLDLSVPLPMKDRVGAPVWSPDSRYLAFSSEKNGTSNVFVTAADGSGEPTPVTTGSVKDFPASWSVRGVLAFVRWQTHQDIGKAPMGDIWTVPMDGDRIPVPFRTTPFDEFHPAFSPDGRWIAYASNETGEFQVHVRPFPGGEPAVQISKRFGDAPLWSPSGDRIYYNGLVHDSGRRSPSVRSVYAVNVDTTNGRLIRSAPRKLFDGAFRGAVPVRGYDITRDGRRFVMVGVNTEPLHPVSQIRVILNWTDELQKRLRHN